MTSCSVEKQKVFFSNRWRHPFCRWKKRLSPLFICSFFSFFSTFSASYFFTIYINKSVPLVQLSEHSILCVMLATAITFVAYYTRFRLQMAPSQKRAKTYWLPEDSPPF